MAKIEAIASASVYEPRCAERTLLDQVVAEELDGFLSAALERGHPLPRLLDASVGRGVRHLHRRDLGHGILRSSGRMRFAVQASRVGLRTRQRPP